MIYVYQKPMPGYCHEMVTAKADGSYTIVMNEALSFQQKQEAYAHAMRHVCMGHFDYDCPYTVDEMEIQAHAEKEG